MRKIFLFTLLLASFNMFGQVKSDTEMGTYNNTYIRAGLVNGVRAADHNTLNKYILASKIHKDSISNVRVLPGDTCIEIRYKTTLDTLCVQSRGEMVRYLDDLLDVDLTDVDSQDILRFDDESNLWKNVPMPEFAAVEDTSKWRIDPVGDDTIKTNYNVVVDSSFQAAYNNTFIGYGDPLGEGNTGIYIYQIQDDTLLAFSVSQDGDTPNVGMDIILPDNSNASISVADDDINGYRFAQMYVSDGDTIWSRINVTPGSIIFNTDTAKFHANVRVDSSLVLPNLPEASKTGKVLHINQYDKVEWMSLSGLGDDIDSARASAPTAYTTWVRDSVNGVLSPATAADIIESEDAVIFGGTHGEGWTEPDIGIGSRFMWYPRKSAIRAGYVDNDAWDTDSIGEYSTAFGINNKAIGAHSISIGNSNRAYGESSVALGYNNSASGFISTAVGWGCISDDVASVALGEFGQSLGYASFAFNNGIADSNYSFAGNGGHAYNDYAFAFGVDNTATAEWGTVFGYNNVANTFNSFYIGRNSILNAGGNEETWVSTDPLFVIGNGSSGVARNNALTIYKNGVSTFDTLVNAVDFTAIRNISTDSLYVAGDAEFNEDVDVGGVIKLPATTSTIGKIMQGTGTILHTYTDNAAQPNIFIGENAGSFTTTGNYNYTYGNNTLVNNSSGNYNIATGAASLHSNTSGSNNVGIGNQTIYFNQTGNGNLAIGDGALHGVSGSSQSNVVAIGSNAAYNHVGGNNVWIGSSNGYGAESGSANGVENTSIGYGAFFSVESASYNTGVGRGTMFGLSTGNFNTSLGYQASRLNATGNNNVSIGAYAGYYNTLSNRLFIDSGDKGSLANDTTQSLIYGNLSANTLRINGAEINPKGTLANNDVSPSVAGGNVWQYNGTANSVTLDALDDHVVGAFYTIIGNSDTYTITVIDGTPAGGDSFNLAGGNWVGGSQDVLMLYCIAADAFVEVSRSDN